MRANAQHLRFPIERDLGPGPRYGAHSRGITARDVELAADALVRASERLTIEKIREKIGRGSPNTINPH
jgi:plasmid replication DNA-binding protein KfrA